MKIENLSDLKYFVNKIDKENKVIDNFGGSERASTGIGEQFSSSINDPFSSSNLF